MAKKVLLVEDHPELRKMVAAALRSLGYDLLEAADGQTGINLAVSERPDLVLLNLSLPGPSGVEVAKQLKGDSKTSHIPIVACSGWDNQKIVQESLRAGVVEYVTKPVSPKKIDAIIKKHVGVEG
jgi:CheY-like chemotaxis protein